MPETQPETQPETEPVQPRFQCRHIHASGHRCASPSLRRETFCYFHHTTRKPISQQDLADRRGHQASFRLPPTEDRTAIQLAIDEVLRRIAAHSLDLKRAGLLLYGLQIASSNLPKPMQTKAQPAHPPAGTVEEIVLDEAHGPLAPVAEFQSAPHEKSLSEILLEQWAKDEADEAARATEAAARAAAEDTAEAAQAAQDAPPPEDKTWQDPDEDFDTIKSVFAVASSSRPKSSKPKARETRPRKPFHATRPCESAKSIDVGLIPTLRARASSSRLTAPEKGICFCRCP